MGIVWIVPISGLIALIFAISLAKNVLSRDPGTARMQEIGATILEGAMAFLKRQYTTIGILAIFTAVIIGVLVGLLRGHEGIEGMPPFGIAWHTAVAFIAGAFCSAISGYVGMYV
ncbi:MAG: sodium-translocating pyrophosphatase, partial [Deltaproteobacteria bacterium]